MKPESVPANNWSLIISQNPTECSKLQTSDYIRWTNQMAFALTALKQNLALKQDSSITHSQRPKICASLSWNKKYFNVKL